MIWLTLSLALATSNYDPTVADETFVGAEASTADGSIRLWAEVERHRDPGAMFGSHDFNEGLAWKEDDLFAPFIRDMFGTGEPESDAFLLHAGLHAGIGQGTPVLFVPGAGDNASRGMVTMLFRFDNMQPARPAYAMTFAHPHGDVFEQAEALANAIARVKVLTGSDEVDVVGHSKGGIALALYLSHTDSATWSHGGYTAGGTPYRGDVRRAVFIATPLGGVDTVFRWPANNYAALDADLAVSPASWDTWYPNGSAFPLTGVDMSAQDLYAAGSTDLFTGQRQITRPQSHPLPGSLPWLGSYALLQQDWYTTWNGGYGFVSHSEGIDAAVTQGGDVIGQLEAQGVDPDVELFLLAGTNPLLTNGAPLLGTDAFGETWGDFIGATTSAWSNLIGDVIANTVPGLEMASGDLSGLVSGNFLLGDITGPSDGLVFVDSALRSETLTARGAVVVEAREVNLSHLDLMYASPVTGQLILDEVASDPQGNAWKEGLGQRYVDEDSIGWVDAVLADPVVVEPPVEEPVDPPVEEPDPRPDGSELRPFQTSCSTSGRPAGAWMLLGMVWVLRRRGVR